MWRIALFLLLIAGQASADLPRDSAAFALHDSLGLRTSITRQLGLATNLITPAYDGIIQLTSWTAAQFNGTPRTNEQLHYGFDAAGNLQNRTNNALVQAFTVDSLNQLSNLVRSGTLTVSGAIPAPPGSVAVNGTNAQTNADFTFASGGNVLTNNGTNTFVIIAKNIYGTNTVTNTLNVDLPSRIVFKYDANGNLTKGHNRPSLPPEVQGAFAAIKNARELQRQMELMQPSHSTNSPANEKAQK